MQFCSALSGRALRSGPDKCAGMDPRGSERVAIVAGASGAIGSATARAFIDQRINLVLAGLPGPILQGPAGGARAGGLRVLVVPIDITRRSDIDVLVAKTLVEFGRIDVLINAAGIGSTPSIC